MPRPSGRSPCRGRNARCPARAAVPGAIGLGVGLLPRDARAAPRRAHAGSVGLAGLFLLAALALPARLPADAPRAAEPLLPSAERLLGWVRDLAAPGMEGRAAGTAGADRAAAYVAGEFRRIGLRPAGDGGGYLQRFTVATRVRLGPANTLEVAAPGRPPRGFAVGRDFLPFTFSADGTVEAEAAYAGYGISAPALGYDDYAGLDVRGRAVLVMMGEPRERDPGGPFRRPEHFHYTELRHKVLNAREHGAAAVLVVDSPARPEAALPPLRGTSPSWGLPAVGVTRAVAAALLGPAGLDLAALHAEIDRTGAPASRDLRGVRVRLQLTLVREHGETANVVGLLPGSDPALRHETVVIGGHYDHLGRGSPFSLDPSRAEALHPGADDNASGTAVVLGLAEAFARARGTRRSLVFVAFGAEELGLLGSTHYVQSPAVPLEHTVAMLNLDSVGRMRQRRLYAMGVDSGQGLRALVQAAAAGLDVELVLRGDGIGPSDHTPFYTRGRPVVFFFTGTHADYHRPSDTPDKVDAEGLRTVAAVAYRVVRALAERDDRPAFVRVPGAGTGRRGGGGYGPYFGIVPEFGEGPVAGVRLGGVRPGSPAERAGLQAGDVIVAFAGVPVRTLDDLVFALRRHRPGDRVPVTYLRDGREHTAEATLEVRR